MGVPYAEVIGDPVAHSKSPAIHKFWLERLGLAGDYRAIRVTEAELGDYFAERAQDPDWRGCNVTMPLKRAVHPFVSLDPPARRIGAVNTIMRHDSGLLLGMNTDWQGVHFALDTPNLRPASAAVIGTGGGARAALEELSQAKVPRVDLLSRSPEQAKALLGRFELEGEVLDPGAAPEVDLLINASPLGMAGYPPLELDLSGLRDGATVLDMVYNPRETALLREARRLDLNAVDGLSMLIGQAFMAFSYFFGQPPPEEYDTPELRARLDP